jgi:molecular chaperone HtpG
MADVPEHRFQIHLGGIIDLLSNHLYSSPSVYIRELLQNATDAIRARRHLEPGRPEGTIRLTVGANAEGRAQLTIEDDGVGLTEEEVHRFLATIGASSKREELEGRRSDFIGQFGIGLLSCFVVSEEIAVLTRSATGGPSISWRGRGDGTYTIETLEEERGLPEPGTMVHLVAKKDAEAWFDLKRVSELARRFGSLLPIPIELCANGRTERVNEEPPPWRRSFASVEEARAASLDFGKAHLNTDLFDVIPLQSDAGAVQGLAFVLPYSPSPTSPPAHRVYLKDMLLAERAENLLPRWAFFVTCVLNTNDLRPTASRESFYEDANLQAAREALGASIRDYLVRLRTEDPRRLEILISLHFRAIKALAAHDSEFLALFLDLLPFETSMGRMSFGEIRARFDGKIWFAPTVDVFRQIAQVASAQGIGVINAGYSYDADLLARASEVYEGLDVRSVDAADLTSALDEVHDPARYEELLAVAARTLAPYRCDVSLKRFDPAEMPVLYASGEDVAFQRAVEQSQKADSEDGLWATMLEKVGEPTQDAKASLVFNAANPLVGRLARATDEDALRLTTQMLYVQALLLGHHPLRAEEMSLLSVGLIDLIEWGLARDDGPTLQ